MNKINATTDVSPEDYHDTVYQVSDGEKPKHKYVQAIKIYGDDDTEAVASGRCGHVHTLVLLDLDNPQAEGTEESYHPSELTRPDIFPSLVRSPMLWKASYETPLPELAMAAWDMVEREFFNEATAGVGQQFKLETDANKVVNAVKVMLSGYFGGFVLLQLLGWIKKKLFDRIHQLNPPHPVSVDAKLSDIRLHGLKGIFDSRRFDRYYSGASSDADTELVPVKVLDALSRTVPHRPVALVVLRRSGRVEHQPIYRHDIEMDESTLVDDKISVKAIIALAISMNMDEAECPEIQVVLEFCADKSRYSATASVSAGEITVKNVSCEQAGALSPHSLIETRKTLKDMMLTNFVSSIKAHGLFTHKKHTRSAIVPFNVGRSLVSHLNKAGIAGVVFQTNSANDTGVEILVLEPAGEHHRLIGYVTDKSIGATDDVHCLVDSDKFQSLDTTSVLQGEEPVVVLGTNPLMSFAASDVKDEYIASFIKDSLTTLKRIICKSSVFPVSDILITTNPASPSTPVAEREVTVDFRAKMPEGFLLSQLENFRSVAGSRFASRNPSSIMLEPRDCVPGGSNFRYTFKGSDVDLAIELLYTVLQHSITR